MARQTIDFGIDLGTTNSSIAVLERTDHTSFEIMRVIKSPPPRSTLIRRVPSELETLPKSGS